jgi:Protein of unknown function (DUF1592)/Protein of unknown function (DUF1588)/Protein of unknown function (DUF1595)/Protein of unknown function (DUF1587)/Protein of unknown function (DUF1585)
MKSNLVVVLVGVIAAAAGISQRYAGTVVEAQTPAPSFADTVYPVLQKANCRSCHSDDGVASGTRLHFPPDTASTEDIEAFGLTLASLVDRTDPNRSLLLNKPTNRERHVGGVKIVPGSPEEQTLRVWVQHLTSVSDAAVSAARARLDVVRPAVAHDVGLRRLTHSQYNNTVRDLVGDHSRPADRFPPEDFVGGFKNQTRAQGIPPVLEDAYSRAAERIALNAFRAGDVNNLIPCKPSSARDAKCRNQFVRAFGEKAFRRPLTDVEVRRYDELFAAEAAKTAKFLEGARVVVEAMLQSPKFLFHVTGGDQRDYAIANRLSYLLWDSMPDRALLDAAAKGELRTPEGIERLARTMLQNVRARQATDEFLSQWLRFDIILGAAKDARRYPSFSPELAAMMVQETKMLLGHLVWNDGSFMDAFTAEYTFLNGSLAQVYGLPAPAGEFELVKFPADARRAGILGQASFLASTAGPVETSPTARGMFVREHLLCQVVPNPPPGVNTTLPEPSADAVQAKRDRMLQHVENQSCAGCHRLMDPIGFGLEKYDAIGAWRDKEMVELGGEEGARRKTAEIEISSVGEIAGVPNSTFTDARELGKVLASSPICQECVVKQMFRYAFGRPEMASDRPTVAGGVAAFRQSGFKFKEMLIALVRSPQFLEGL